MLGRAVIAILALALPAQGQDITAARYTDPTTRYAHGVFGDIVEWGTLEFTLNTGQTARLVLPQNRVFEDLAPRLYDLDQDGDLEAVVIESHANYGARLAIYDWTGLVDATPYIGHRNRWLAPFAITDLDGDGLVELAYIDRPHLAKTLRVWRFANGGLSQVASLTGLTNHRFGQDYISGGVRDCGDGVEMILASANWSQVMAVRLQDDSLKANAIGPFNGPASWGAALSC